MRARNKEQVKPPKIDSLSRTIRRPCGAAPPARLMHGCGPTACSLRRSANASPTPPKAPPHLRRAAACLLRLPWLLPPLHPLSAKPRWRIFQAANAAASNRLAAVGRFRPNESGAVRCESLDQPTACRHAMHKREPRLRLQALLKSRRSGPRGQARVGSLPCSRVRTAVWTGRRRRTDGGAGRCRGCHPCGAEKGRWC